MRMRIRLRMEMRMENAKRAREKKQRQPTNDAEVEHRLQFQQLRLSNKICNMRADIKILNGNCIHIDTIFLDKNDFDGIRNENKMACADVSAHFYHYIERWSRN